MKQSPKLQLLLWVWLGVVNNFSVNSASLLDLSKLLHYRGKSLKMPPKRTSKAKSKEIVSSSRFKCFRVEKRISIREFFKANSLEFAIGKGYYQLTKPETIQFHKEIVVRRKCDGKLVTGIEVRWPYLLADTVLLDVCFTRYSRIKIYFLVSNNFSNFLQFTCSYNQTTVAISLKSWKAIL